MIARRRGIADLCRKRKGLRCVRRHDRSLAGWQSNRRWGAFAATRDGVQWQESRPPRLLSPSQRHLSTDTSSPSGGLDRINASRCPVACRPILLRGVAFTRAWSRSAVTFADGSEKTRPSLAGFQWPTNCVCRESWEPVGAVSRRRNRSRRSPTKCRRSTNFFSASTAVRWRPRTNSSASKCPAFISAMTDGGCN